MPATDGATVTVGATMARYSIVGVTYFRDDSPDDFGSLDRAFVTMFRITAGETWVGTPLSPSTSLPCSPAPPLPRSLTPSPSPSPLLFSHPAPLPLP